MVDDVLYLSQQKYIKELLDRCGIMDTKNVDTPMTSGKGLNKTNGIPLIDANQYRSLIGGL